MRERARVDQSRCRWLMGFTNTARLQLAETRLGSRTPAVGTAGASPAWTTTLKRISAADLLQAQLWSNRHAIYDCRVGGAEGRPDSRARAKGSSGNKRAIWRIGVR